MHLIRIKIFVIFAWIWLSVFHVGAALSSINNIDKNTVQKIVMATNKHQWGKALVLSENLDDPILKTYVSWAKLRMGFGSFEDYNSFLKNYLL